MACDIDPACDKARCKIIILAGEQYYVAPLPLRHVLAIADLIPKLSGITVQNMRGEMFDPVLELIRRGLLKTYPGLTMDDLLDLPITIAELLEATPVVVEQAGGRKADVPAGEI